MKVFFQYAWNRQMKNVGRRCECGCGNLLPKEINTACIDHLLEKREYPELKYSFGNIGFFTAECHARKTNGHPNANQKRKIESALRNYDLLKEESRKFEQKLEKLINQNGESENRKNQP